MCALLSRIDLAAGLHPVRVSAGEVVYPPGGRLGPRWQHDIELVLVHSGSARIEVDDEPPLLLRPDSLALLLPGRGCRRRSCVAAGGQKRHPGPNSHERAWL
jgi:hypothetical protein